MIYKSRSSYAGKVTVIFEIPGTIWTESVHLVGDFNNWDRESLPFQRDWKEDWTVEVEVDAGRQYRFRYLFDDHNWCNDWHADGCVRNPLGFYDSVIVTEARSEADRGASI